jgi:glutamyl-tRNA synthetase
VTPSTNSQVTRLAPSPTGALHLGNARTFLINWAMARQNGWRIVLRIEDLDTPRVKPGVIELTINLLTWLGMDWDEGPYIQSHDLAPYRLAMETLASRSKVYPSSLTRTQIEAAASAPQEGSHEVLYPASLRPSEFPPIFDDAAPSWRLIVPDERVAFEDSFLGTQEHIPSRTIGDFVVWTRRDPKRPGQPAYQLAVVVDDHRQGITQVVRGDDLLDSAARQLLLYRALGLTPEPTYTHLPLVRGEDGKRLAKRHGDTRLDAYRLRAVTPQRVIGLIAHWSGVGPPNARPQPMDAQEFRQAFNLRTMSKDPVTFTAEDDAWLTS